MTTTAVLLQKYSFLGNWLHKIKILWMGSNNRKHCINDHDSSIPLKLLYFICSVITFCYSNKDQFLPDILHILTVIIKFLKRAKSVKKRPHHRIYFKSDAWITIKYALETSFEVKRAILNWIHLTKIECSRKMFNLNYALYEFDNRLCSDIKTEFDANMVEIVLSFAN